MLHDLITMSQTVGLLTARRRLRNSPNKKSSNNFHRFISRKVAANSHKDHLKWAKKASQIIMRAPRDGSLEAIRGPGRKPKHNLAYVFPSGSLTTVVLAAMLRIFPPRSTQTEDDGNPTFEDAAFTSHTLAHLTTARTKPQGRGSFSLRMGRSTPDMMEEIRLEDRGPPLKGQSDQLDFFA